MKRQIQTSVLLVSVCIITAFGAACTGQQPANKGTANSEPIIKTDAPKAPSDKGDTVATGGDLSFLNATATGNMAEVELGKLALEKAESADVKMFAQKMIDDHSKALDELKQVSSQKKVTPPMDILPTQKELKEKLSKLSGAEFDKEYVMAMVKEHENDVTAFEAASKTAADADVKEFATKTLPTLKMHSEMIKVLAEKMGASKK